MATSSKWLGHQPFTLAMQGSSPAVVTIKYQSLFQCAFMIIMNIVKVDLERK